MNWLYPIGFLGLLSLVILVLIYIIKPNYQNKRISSTYIWRASLKYKKQRIPISKIQNLLMFLCQVLILAILATLIAGPIIASARGGDEDEVVIIVDASAGMRMGESGDTRFHRALAEAKKKAQKAFDSKSSVSFILANDAPEFLFRRIGPDGEKDALALIDQLSHDGVERCIWSAADMSAATTLAESVLASNPEAQVYLYTGTDYTYHEGVNVVDVAKEGEWNATILDCKAELDNDNHYKITITAACYEKTDFITVYCKVHGVNGDSSNAVLLERGEFFDPSAEERSVVFTSDDFPSGAIYSYDYIEAYISVRDSFADDNFFLLYGGSKPVIKIQYASSSPNNYFESAVRSLRQYYRDVWDVQYTALNEKDSPATEGFDLYIFEHTMPDVLPTDGVVLLVDPNMAPVGSGLQVGGAYQVESSSILSPGEAHELTKYVDPQRITIAKYNDIVLSEDYRELAFYNGRPVMLLKDTPEAKVIVWAFDLNYSNLIALPDFSFLIYNMFNHFLPSTFTGNAFEIGDSVQFNGRGTDLTVTGNGQEYAFEDAKGEIVLANPGTYTATQTAMDGETLLVESFFVKIPSSESDPSKTVDVLPSVESGYVPDIEYQDLLLYFAIALVSLMFAEWVLEIKKNY